MAYNYSRSGPVSLPQPAPVPRQQVRSVNNTIRSLKDMGVPPRSMVYALRTTLQQQAMPLSAVDYGLRALQGG